MTTAITTNSASISTHSTLYPKATSTILYKTHFSLPLTFSKPQILNSFQLSCFQPTSPAPSPPPSPPPPNITATTITKTLILLTFSLTLLTLRLTSKLLLPDFHNRWNDLITFSSEAETKLIDHYYPHNLLLAIVAYEDRRFFRHFGVDPVGIARAVLSFSKRGGGSTITQQLVKNTFLKNERTFLRKIVEMVLALALERRISKLKILSSYMSKIYWGHGIYGTELASTFYFGKNPSLLNLGECALLAGIIPGPEIRSPFRDSSRGKRFQARVLRRMVQVGFIDINTALHVLKQPLNFNSCGVDYDDGIYTKLKEGVYSDFKNIWDWETESKIWEVQEDMERWAREISKQLMSFG